MPRFWNPRFKCRVCWRWTIRRGTRHTQRIAWCPALTKICLECADTHTHRSTAGTKPAMRKKASET